MICSAKTMREKETLRYWKLSQEACGLREHLPDHVAELGLEDIATEMEAIWLHTDGFRLRRATREYLAHDSARRAAAQSA